MGGFEHETGIWELRIRQSILDLVNLGRGQNLSSGKRISILCNERQLTCSMGSPTWQRKEQLTSSTTTFRVETYAGELAGLNECS